MEQQDYLKRQIDQIGQLLGQMLADLLDLKGQGKISEGIEITNQSLKSELGIDIQELMNIPVDDFISKLKTGKVFGNENLDKLADILMIIADNKHESDKKILYERCLRIYEYLQRAENIYSFDRQWKIERIEKAL